MLLSSLVFNLLPWILSAYDLDSTTTTTTKKMRALSSSSRFKIIHDSLYEIGADANYFDNQDTEESVEMSSSSSIVEASSRQVKIWEFMLTFDSFKTSVSYKNNEYGKPTLENIKYIILPIWWNDYNMTDPSNVMDPAKVVSSFEINKPYYIDMSWGKMPNGVTWQVLPQELLPVSSVSPTFGDTKDATKDILLNKGFIEEVDYDAICLMYFKAQSGPFDGGGGWASVNGTCIFVLITIMSFIERLKKICARLCINRKVHVVKLLWVSRYSLFIIPPIIRSKF